MAALLSVIQLSDDSVEAGYEDGSRLWLAPCGTEFVIERSEDGAHPLRTPERRKQRTEFVTSCCRDKVLQILTFRNTFSSRPFLPLSIVPKEKTVSLLSEISEVVWPDSEDDDHCKTYVACLEDGGVKVSSLDGNAHLYMSALQKEFTVEFLCQLSSKVEVSIHASESHVEGITKDLKNRHLSQQTDSTRDSEREANIANTNTCITTSKYSSCVIREREDSGFYCTKHAFQYTWLAQCFSVACCPEAFLYPMSLALHVQNKMSPDEERLDCLDDELEKNLKRAKSSVLPKALPLSCRGTHLHRWNVCDFRKQPSCLFPLKVAMCNTILYRFFFQGMHFIEIYPGDGSVFISEGRWLGKYFQYYFLNGKIRPKEHRLYTTSNLPPDMPRALYSVRSVIEQAGRFLKMCHNTMLSQSPLFESCCWRDESSSNAQTVFPVLLAKATVPDKGTYTVYSDNTVLAHFLDGVYLHMTWNFNHFNKQEQTVKAKFIW
ncbi:Hypothetical predicted protein [Pelobates cultripes]|uniref:Uncharacterized protein n=1 Tax=Pelobates cultripes TaxID=61616 RepID=A0AAD1SAU1_PELCU|nr:Hypothetical predicted protein [Pelobates cultripes]